MKKFLKILTISFFMMSFVHSAHAEKIKLILDWFPNPDHAPIFVAQQQGFFQAVDLDVEIVGPADPADPPKLVAVGKADIAITYEPQLIEQIEQGLPLVRVGTLIDKPLDCLVVLNDSPIKSIADLKGKTIGSSATGFADIVLKTMLETNHLTLNDVKEINVHYDLSQALLSKKIDAATGMMRTFEPIQLELAGHPARLFLPENNGVPTYNELIFVINKKNVNDARYKKFITALQNGVTYLRQHPEESWQQFAKAHPELNDELNHRAWLAALPYFSATPHAFNSEEWLNFAAYMQKNGLIKQVKPIDTYAIDLSKG